MNGAVQEDAVLEVFEIADDRESATDFSAVLTYAERQKSRCRAVTTSGQAFGWFLPRGGVLMDGDVLLATNGSRIAVKAAEENLSKASSADPLTLLQAAYHLGNRHVPLQVEVQALYYQHDHVLDAMVTGLGLSIDCVKRAFNPESGAYHSHSAGHHHH